jgi:hypothetical protein
LGGKNRRDLRIAMTEERRDAIELWNAMLPHFMELRPLTAVWAATLRADEVQGGVLRLVTDSRRAAESMRQPRAIADLERLAGRYVLVELEE